MSGNGLNLSLKLTVRSCIYIDIVYICLTANYLNKIFNQIVPIILVNLLVNLLSTLVNNTASKIQNHFGPEILSCQPRVPVTSCFVYKVIRDLESIDHLCINPICRIGLIQK